jgi:Protein of unknown function (DUF2442)
MSKLPVVRVTEVEVLHDRLVRVRFDDGATRERDLSPLLTGPVFEQIRDDESTFRQIKVDPSFGVITWPNGADVDAELLRHDDLWGQAIAPVHPA